MSDLRASVAVVRCLAADLPLFVRTSPKTPLRVLGIIALDALHLLRHSRRMSRDKISALARFIDFEGCANAAWDRKALCDREYRALRHRLEEAGLGLCLDEYLARLAQLEGRRPSIGGEHRRPDEVRVYREAVARLSMTTAAAIALNAPGGEVDIAAFQSDRDVETLFRILMQCQIIDDVVDYEQDLYARLPTLLTASASLDHGLASTARAARLYGAVDSSAAGVLPLRMALGIVTALATFIVWIFRVGLSTGIHHSVWRWTAPPRR